MIEYLITVDEKAKDSLACVQAIQEVAKCCERVDAGAYLVTVPFGVVTEIITKFPRVIVKATPQ